MIKWPAPIDHTYILCNPKKEPDRVAYLEKWFSANNIDPSCYTIGYSCYGVDLSIGELQRLHNHQQPRTPVQYKNCFRGVGSGRAHDLNPSEISLVVNWAAAAKKAVLAGHQAVMILESDVLFSDNFIELLGAAMKPLEGRPWDFLSLSAGTDLRPQRGPGSRDGWFPAHPYYHTRTCDAMIFKVSMLKKILGTLFPFVDVLDWEMNYQLTLHNSISLWLDPPIISQGSNGGVYVTTLAS
jgi:hypothetical protein